MSKDRDIDLEEVHSYELASVPLALANMDGSLRKPTKSTLLKELEMDSLSESTLPAYSLHQTAYIVGLLAIIQMLSKGKMKTFGELSDTIAGTIIAKFQFASQVHIVPDRYDVEDSIKSGERSRRSQWTAIEIKIQSRETKLPASLKRYLSSGKNKSNLLTFLLSDWCENLPGQLKDGETLILASQDGSAVKVTKTLNREAIIPLYSDHEEADSRMFVHCEYITNQVSGNSNSIKRIIACRFFEADVGF